MSPRDFSSSILKMETKLSSYYGMWLFMLKFVDDLAGSIYDILKFIIRSLSYLLVGMIIVAIPMYLIAWVFGFFK